MGFAKSDFLGGFCLFFGVADTNILIYNPVTVNFLLAIKVTFLPFFSRLTAETRGNPILRKSQSGLRRGGPENADYPLKNVCFPCHALSRLFSEQIFPRFPQKVTFWDFGGKKVTFLPILGKNHQN